MIDYNVPYFASRALSGKSVKPPVCSNRECLWRHSVAYEHVTVLEKAIDRGAGLFVNRLKCVLNNKWCDGEVSIKPVKAFVR